MQAPIIGITCDIDQQDAREFLRPFYAKAVGRAGGVPVTLSPQVDLIQPYLDICDGFVFSGGDDPIMEAFGEPTHPDAKPVHETRQRFELALLRALERRPRTPVLGICLGMQYMGLTAGGRLDQHLPHSQPGEIAERHWGRREHGVALELPQGTIRGCVLSHHRQAITDAGALEVCGRATEDGMIEAVRDSHRAFYLGVQWHPERTNDTALGAKLFEMLIAASRRSRSEHDALPESGFTKLA